MMATNCQRAEPIAGVHQPEPRLRIVAGRTSLKTRRARRAIFGRMEQLFFVGAAAGLIWFSASCGIQGLQSYFSPVSSGTATLTVQPGDTLWKISARLSGGDEQQVDKMNEIRSLNPVLAESGQVIAGQKIVVPVERRPIAVELHLAQASAQTTVGSRRSL